MFIKKLYIPLILTDKGSFYIFFSYLSALFLGGLMNFGFIFYIILSESTTLAHTGKYMVHTMGIYYQYHGTLVCAFITLQPYWLKQ